jgi:predicted nuclease of predicted toxin-antitoxin system
MARLLADENFNHDIVRGLLLKRPNLDIVTVHDAQLAGADDQVLLEWAATQNRILLTHDRATMPDYAFQRVLAGSPMPGIFVLRNRFPVGDAIEEILFVIDNSESDDWNNRVVWLPL